MSSRTTRPEESPPNAKAAAAEDRNLSNGVRTALALFGLALVGAGLAFWYFPSKTTEFAPAATSAAQTAEVEDRSETMTAVLVGVGAALVLIAANGRKLRSFTVAGQTGSFEGIQAVGDQAAGHAASRAREQNLDPSTAAVAAELARAAALDQAMTATPREVNIEAIAAQAVATAAEPKIQPGES